MLDAPAEGTGPCSRGPQSQHEEVMLTKANTHQLNATSCALQKSSKTYLCRLVISTYRSNHCRAKIGRQQICFFVIPAKCLLEWKSTPAQYCSSNSGVTVKSQIPFHSPREARKACNGNSGINRVTIYVQTKRLVSLTCLL